MKNLISKPMLAIVSFIFMMAASQMSMAGNNPFAMSDMAVSSNMQLADGKCGAGKCGASMNMKKKESAKCGDSMKKKDGEGKCGDSMKKKDGEGKCGDSMKKKPASKCGASHMKEQGGKCSGK